MKEKIEIQGIEMEIDHLINCDPLYEAEKITGKSYKEDRDTESLGFIIMQRKSKEMGRLMTETGDTKFSENMEDYLSKVLKMGFSIVIDEDFQDGDENEKYYLLYHPKGLVLSMDSFHGSRNGATLYYNWFPNDLSTRGHVTSSGSFFMKDRELVIFDLEGNTHSIPDTMGPEPHYDHESDIGWEQYLENDKAWHKIFNEWMVKESYSFIWVGNHDGREALQFKINQLESFGTFLTEWIDFSDLNLNHHMDWKDLDDTKPYDEKYKTVHEESDQRLEILKRYIGELNKK